MKKSALLAFVLLGAFSQAADYTTKTLKSAKPEAYQAMTTYLVWSASHPLAKVANPVLKEWATKLHNSWVKDVVDAQKAGEKPTSAWELEIGQEVVRGDIRVISVIASIYDYSGGAHPNHGSASFNFAMIGGKPKRLTLEDLFRKGSNPGKMVSAKVIAKLKNEEGADLVKDGEIKVLDKKQLDHFTIGADGLTWYFDPYEVGPYAAGDFQVKLTWKELGPSLNRAIVLGR